MIKMGSYIQLPYDIKWKRLCVSEDMVDLLICDKRFPPKWCSSLALFTYEPPEEQQVYENRIISYIKIAATITNFLPDDGQSKGCVWFDPLTPYGMIELMDHMTYPCYGALIQVSVGPTRNNRKIIEIVKMKIDFTTYQDGDELENPITIEDITFVNSLAKNTIVILPNNEMALYFDKSLGFEFPASEKIIIKLFGSDKAKLKIEIFNEDQSLLSREIALTGEIREIIFEMTKITKLKIVNQTQEKIFLHEIEIHILKLKDLAIADYPYIMDFEPKKRELYETASETKEVLSRSMDAVNIQKGTTNMTSNEVVDIDKGWFFSQETHAGTGFFEGGGTTEGGRNYEKGTRKITGKESTNIQTTDTSREKRESYAFTTNITQMYHQFISYHLGTNRSVFFMLPRPHTVTSDYTFINGPIELQGIQEILLVINRPKGLENFCVETTLETAHIETKMNFDYYTEVDVFFFPRSEGGELKKSFSTPEIKYWLTNRKNFIKIYTPENGWKIDLDRNGGYEIVDGVVVGTEITIRYGMGDETKTIFNDNFTIKAEEHQIEFSADNFQFPKEKSHSGMTGVEIEYKGGIAYRKITIYLRSINPEISENLGSRVFFIGRDLCCCSKGKERVNNSRGNKNDYVTYENEIREAKFISPSSLRGKKTGERILANNRLVKIIGKSMISSFGSTKRFPLKTKSFLETDVFASAISDRLLINVKDSEPILKYWENKELKAFIEESMSPNTKIGDVFDEIKADEKKSKYLTRKFLFQQSVRVIAHIMKIPEDEVRRLKLALIGLSLRKNLEEEEEEKNKEEENKEKNTNKT